MTGIRRYQLIDLSVLALVLCLLEAACALALNYFSGEVYTLSPSLFLALLVMMRWGGIGTLYSVLGSGIYCLLHGASGMQLAVYLAGGIALAGNLLWVRFVGKKRLRDSAVLSVLYGVTGYALICAGRAISAAILGGEAFVSTLVRFFSVDALSAVFTVGFILIARKQNGLFEDQREYLLRLSKEKEERKRGT